ncbi:bleomycin resistance protein [Pararhodospirillum photometricum]|uniref:bleomycin resistance protein n=1 Tax=Pararhodospirillum photometricum TaxID=1084 RepID=UPI0002E2B143|nr:VOC family protein [Pararhodospirillum photometricum]
MASKPRVLSISPILAVHDVAASVRFYVRHLGFERIFVEEDESYGVVAYDGQSVHFTRAESPAAQRLTRTRLALYISVQGIEGLWRAVRANPPSTRVRALETTPWGGQEFQVVDPDGCLLRFGEEPS